MKTLSITAEQQSNLVAWRAEALELMPYMASVLLNLRPLNAPGLRTFACDARYRLYIDFDEVTPLGARFCAEALLHECCHLFAHDSERAEEHGVKPHERMTFNISADCANNDDLIDAGCASLAEHAMTPSKIGAPDYQTAEFYFDFLKQTQDDDESGDDPQGGQPSSGDGEGESSGEGNGQQSGDGQGQSSSQSAPGDNQNEGWTGCGSAAGGEKAPCELDEDDDANGAAPAANDVEIKITDIATATEIKEYASKHPGTTPRGLVERADQILKPSELGWRQILSSAVRRAAASRAGDFDTTYSRRARRQSHREFGGGTLIQPGIESPVPRLVIVRDTSGSMSPDDLNTVTSEVDAIAKQLGVRGENLIVLDVDAEVAATRKYRKASDLAEIAGRGGTDMCVGIEAAAVLRPAPSAIVVITDGWTPWPDVKTRVPVVVCIVGPGANDDALLDRIPAWIITVKVPNTD
jgi:predicted metal-dependent peptidase